jgi:prepilin-type N-terminal cleavage/methylation domain-containing protein
MRRDAAFSLVEVMCAILILGIGLVGFIQGITTALGSSKESELQTTAMLLAEGKIEEVRADGWLVDGETEGTFEGDLYQWRQTVTGTSIKGLHQVDLVVESASSGKQICELHTMFFEPYIATETEQESNKKQKDKGDPKEKRRRARE